MKWTAPSRRRIVAAFIVVAVAAIAVYLNTGPRSGHVIDEAKLSQRDAGSFPAADEDYFRDMDGGVALSPDEIKGRNTWLVWTAGNDRFWDRLIGASLGNFDLLKTLSSYPGLKFSRANRWDYLGLVNEPCFAKATAPNPQRFGLWLDTRQSDCSPDPFENEKKYPGVAIGARGKNMPVGSYYGYGSGIVGLRLFPNPDFNEAAQKAWDPVRYYTDPSYYNSKDLIRPYRVGMSCGFCHVGPDPVRPPADAENPKWENLSSTVGAQYFWVNRIFNWSADPENYVYQLMSSARPGTLDTSLITTDYINNPRTMNAIYQLGPRLELARDRGKEVLSGGNLDSKQFNDYFKTGPLAAYFEHPATAWAPRVLKDGSDSIGALGALNRVYLNIGLFSEEWLLHFNPLVGGKALSPIHIKVASENSSYWQSTEAQTPAMGLFLAKAGTPHKLAAAPGGADYLKDDVVTLDRGKAVFAETCARCHSSKYPSPPPDVTPGSCEASDYLSCWNKYWSWTKTDDFKSRMRQIVAKPDFLDGNFLSTDMRIPSSLLQTNLCSPLATNAIAGHIWEDFSSQTYKDLPSIGSVTVQDPITGNPRQYTMPAGGRGYTRPASLVSLWSTAPFLLNNSVGRFEPEPSVAARMRSFDDSIHQMLWPERRQRDSKFGTKLPGLIDRVEEPAYLSIPHGYLPKPIQATMGVWSWLAPGLFTNGQRRYDFSGATTVGSKAVANISVPSPLGTFIAGAPVSGPGIEEGSRVVVFDAAAGALILDRPATATGQHVALRTDAPDAELRLGPMPSGMPLNLLAGVELASEKPGVMDQVKHTAKLLGMAWQVSDLFLKTGDSAERATTFERSQGELLSMDKCSDFVVNRGHYFGTDQMPEEPGLSDPDKEALIAFLKTF
jgi:hypothetical protein